MKEKLEEILKKHTRVNKLQLEGPHWNAGIKNGIQTSGHFILFEDVIHAMQEAYDLGKAEQHEQIDKIKTEVTNPTSSDINRIVK